MSRLPIRELQPNAPLVRILWHELARRVTRWIIRVFYRPIIIDRENVPHHGAMLIAANHQSYLDPPLVGDYPIRQTAFVARAGLFKVPVLGWCLKTWNSTPIKESGNDKAAILEVLSRLKDGHAVVIFPEGRRCKDGAMHPFKRGLSLLVKMGKVPVVPVAVEGCFDCFPPGHAPRFYWRGPRVAIKYGKPLSYEELMKDGPDGALLHVEREIDRMRLELRALLRSKNVDYFPPAGPGDQPVRRDAPPSRRRSTAEPSPEMQDASPSEGESQTDS